MSNDPWNPNMAIPLVYGDLTMRKMVDQSAENWVEYPDGFLSLVYTADITSELADEIISIPNQSIDTTVKLALSPNLFPGDSMSKYFLFKPSFNTLNNERLDSFLIKSAMLTIDITTNLNHESYVEVIIPEMTKYGLTFIERIDIPNTGGTSVNISKTINIYDYMVRLNHINGSSEIDEYLKVVVKRGNNADNSPYSIKVVQTINSISYYQAYGYFHQHDFDLAQTKLPISLFENLHYSQIFIEDPTLRLKFSNSYGIPMDMTFNELYAEKGTSLMHVNSSLLPTLSLNYPSLSEFGQSDTSIFNFNKSNSNIVDIINFNPQKLVYSGFVRSNPTGVVMPNFVLDTSSVRLNAELEIPLHGRALKFTLEDTSVFDIGDLFIWDKIESVDLNINTLNYFPNEASLQLYLVDSTGLVFDSIFGSQTAIIAAAIPGPPPEYRVTTPNHQMTTINVTASRLANLRKAKKIVISASASTYDQGTKIVKIYSDYKITFELSAKGVYKLEY
jgi:hypothetical protein